MVQQVVYVQPSDPAGQLMHCNRCNCQVKYRGLPDSTNNVTQCYPESSVKKIPLNPSSGFDAYTNILWNIPFALLHFLPNHWLDYLHDVTSPRSLLHTLQYANRNSCIVVIYAEKKRLEFSRHTVYIH